MALVPTSYAGAKRGTPAFEVLDTYTQQNLLAGAEPALQPTNRILLADSTTLEEFTVVGVNAAGRLVAATWNATVASAVVPIGVLVHAAASGATNSTIYGEVFLTGCFNAGADSPLVWDASFDTIAKKTDWAGLPHLRGNPSLLFREAALS